MNARSTQRFVGFVVAAVVTALLLIALPARQGELPELGGEQAAEQAGEHGGDPRDPRAVLPVFEVEDGWWVLVRYGIRLRLPAGWEPQARFDRPFAYRDPAAPLQGSFNVLSLPNFYYPDLAALAEGNRRSLTESEHLELISIEELTLSGDRPVLRIDYRGRPADADLRVAAIVFLLGGHQVVVTAAAGEEEWEAVEASLSASLASIEFLELGTMSLGEQLEGTELEGRAASIGAE